MPSLADLPELVGFFSYSRRDDQHAEGALSRLRARIYGELRLQLGRDLRLWQDTAAIPEGTLWEQEIKSAIAESAFFVPIVTPSAVGSKHCRLEFKSFLDREQALGRNNLIFPLLYVRVPALEREEEWRRDEVLEIIGVRQYIDWQDYRHRDLREPEVARKIELYCRNIVETLRRPWISPEERRGAQEAEARRVAEEAEQRAQEDRRRRAEADARRREEEERRAREAEELRLRKEAQQLAREQEKRRRTENRNRQTTSSAQPHLLEPIDEDLSGTTQRRAHWSTRRVAASAGQYYVAAFLLVTGALGVALAALAFWLDWTASSAGPPRWAMVAWLLLWTIDLGVGFGTITTHRWSRFVGIAVSLVAMLLAGFFAFLVFFVSGSGPGNYFFATLRVCLVFFFIGFAFGACFLVLGWKPDSWLASRIPESVSAFAIFVLINAALALNFLFAIAHNNDSLVRDNVWPWLGILLILELAVAAYCIAAFHSRFGAAAERLPAQSQ